MAEKKPVVDKNKKKETPAAEIKVQDADPVKDQSETRKKHKKDKSRPTVGISMGSGGYRIAFHAGFIDGLTDMGIKVDHFVGTSTGALSAFFAALDIPGYEWLDDVPPFWQLNFVKPGFIERIIKYEVRKRLDLKRKADEERKKKCFEQINSKLKIITATFPDFEPQVFSKFTDMDDLIDKLTASCTVPYWTRFPHRMDEDYFIDGTFSTVFPYELPVRFLESDYKISLRVLPPYFPLNIPNINIMEFYPKKYKYNLIQGIFPFTWMIEDMYNDGYKQAMRSRLDSILGLDWKEKRIKKEQDTSDEDEPLYDKPRRAPEVKIRREDGDTDKDEIVKLRKKRFKFLDDDFMDKRKRFRFFDDERMAKFKKFWEYGYDDGRKAEKEKKEPPAEKE